MKNIFLSCTLVASCIINQQGFAQTSKNAVPYVNAVNILQKTMPRKVTIDGKRIYSVNADHICSITITMESSRQYQFSLITWPEKSHIDDAGYTEYILKDMDNKPHILRTDKIKGKKFLTSIKNIIKNCQESSKNNKVNES